jgi:uncharacterized short protein YbdD (DUF466 family)
MVSPATLAQEAERLGRYLGQTMRLMVGLPDYDTYLAHMAARHPGVSPMSRAEFVRERQEARFGAGGRFGRCC